jgi:hypothetical protein
MTAELKKFPRGIRCNNPMNIRKSSTKWLGEVEGKDAEFETFSSPEYGIRAAVKIIRNYEKLYGIKTVEGIINKWAPPVENDTKSYVKHVASAVGVEPDKPLDLDDPLTLLKLITAMIKHENGIQPYDDNTLKAGIRRAINGSFK